MTFDHLVNEFTRLPPLGTPAAAMTERDKVAIGLALGMPYSIYVEGTRVHLKIDCLFEIADRGDGGYIVARTLLKAT